MSPTPPFDTVRMIQQALLAEGITSAVGGSGLMASLGLVETVNDWDLVTDADPDAVRSVLHTLNLDFQRKEASGIFRTAALYSVAANDHEIDVLVRFALASPAGTARIDAIAGAEWNGLTMARPEEWVLAYHGQTRQGRAAQQGSSRLNRSLAAQRARKLTRSRAASSSIPPA